MTLARRLGRGGLWVASSAVGARLLQAAAYSLLARFLAPADFGAFAIAAVAVNALALFPGLGLGTALMARPGDPRPHARTAITVAWLGGGALALIALLVGHFIARRDGAAVGHLVMLLGVALLFQGPGTVAGALLDRELRFRARAVADLAGGVAFCGTAVAAALLGAGALALGFGLVASAAVQAFVATKAARLAPTRSPELKRLRGTFRVGGLVLATTLLQWLFTSSDIACIAHRFGRDAVGTYTTALQLAMVPASVLGLFSARLALPALMRARAGSGTLDVATTRGFLAAIRVAALLGAAATALFVAFSGPLVELLYGSRFAASAPLVPLLALHAFGRVLGGLAGPALLASGRARVAFGFVLAQNVVALPLALVVPAEFGAAGIALVYSLAALVAGVVALLVGTRAIAVPTAPTLRAALLPLLTLTPLLILGSPRRLGAPGGFALALVSLVPFALLAWRRLRTGATP